MKKGILIILLLALFHIDSISQEYFYCAVDENYDGNRGQTSTITNPKYGHIKSYVPNMDGVNAFHNPPIKTINVNINILQKDDGTGNFQDNEDTRERFRQIIVWINQFYSSGAPSDPIDWVEELPSYDSRIRFSIGEEGNERIYFYKNTEFWDPNNKFTTIQYFNDTYPEKMNAINLYVFGNPENSLNSAMAAYPQPYIYYNQFALCYYWQPVSDYAVANLLGHEFGHSLDLYHTYHSESNHGSNAICDISHEEFIRDVFMLDTITQECNCPHHAIWDADADTINGDGITNNLMGGNKTQRYISPLQAGMMHRSLSLTNVRKYVTCEKSNIPLVITGDETWNFNIKLYQDLIIEQGATLTLSDYLVMLPDAKIIIKPGGKLIVDGATITTDIYETRKWRGIEVWGDDDKHQNLVGGQYHQGYLELRNGAMIENAVCAVELWKPDDYSSEGGIIVASDAVFRNNAKAVHALNYTNYSPNSGNEMDYHAHFTRCSFIIDGEYAGEEMFHKHVDLYNVRGLCIEENSFTKDPSCTSRTYGIAVDDSENYNDIYLNHFYNLA